MRELAIRVLPAGEVRAHVHEMLPPHPGGAKALLQMIPHQVALSLEIVGYRPVDRPGNLPADLEPPEPRS